MTVPPYVLRRQVQATTWELAGTVLEEVPLDHRWPFLVAIVEHGGEAAASEIGHHLLGAGRTPIAQRVFDDLADLGLVTEGPSVRLRSAGVDALRSQAAAVARFGAWNVDLIDLGHGAQEVLRCQRAGPADLGGLVGPGRAMPGSQHFGWPGLRPDALDGSKVPISTLDHDPPTVTRGRSRPITIEVHVDTELEVRLLDGDSSICIDQSRIRLPSRSELDTIAKHVLGRPAMAVTPSQAWDLPEAEVESLHRMISVPAVELGEAGRFDLSIGPCPIVADSASAAEILALRRACARLAGRIPTRGVWDRAAADAAEDLTQRDSRSEVDVSLERAVELLRAAGPRHRSTYRRIRAPIDWDPDAARNEMVIPRSWQGNPVEHLAHVAAAERGRELVHCTERRGRLESTVVEIIEQANSVTILSSFLLGPGRIIDALERAASRDVAVYVLTASEQYVAEVSTSTFDEAREAEHREVLGRLAEVATVRTAPFFHAKCVLADPVTAPAGLLSTANLVGHTLRRSLDLGVVLRHREVERVFRTLRWAFWEAAERELVTATSLSRLDSVGGLTALHEDLIVADGLDSITPRQLGLLEGSPSSVTVSSFSWSQSHPVVRRLVELARAGSEVTVLASPRVRQSAAALQELQDAGATVHRIERLHAKVVAVAGGGAVVSTSNLNDSVTGSLDLAVYLSAGDDRRPGVDAFTAHCGERAANGSG